MNYSEHARCPGCSGDMVFNIEEQKLVCSSCSSKYSVYRYRQIIEEKKKAGAENFTRGATVNPQKTTVNLKGAAIYAIPAEVKYPRVYSP